MKLLILVLITFFINGCFDPQPRTHCTSNMNIRGIVIDSSTNRPIGDVHIDEDIKTPQQGSFYIPSNSSVLSITAIRGEVPWGCDRSFIVRKKGYTPQICVCTMIDSNDTTVTIKSYTYAIIKLVPKHIKVKPEWIDVGSHISCIALSEEL